MTARHLALLLLLTACGSSFELADADNSGSISRPEFIKLMTRLGMNRAQAESLLLLTSPAHTSELLARLGPLHLKVRLWDRVRVILTLTLTLTPT